MTFSLMWLSYMLSATTNVRDKPNIIFLLADDLGWNDVGWHNPDIMTPHLDRLAHEGVILDRAYVHPLCSPSRSALLTGKYPTALGMQHGVLKRDKPQGLPLNEILLPQVLQQLGYSTHIIGKWHLGFCKWAYTPTFRGFDTFLGYYLGGQDYFSHFAGQTNMRGYDFRFNTKVFRPKHKRYSTFEFAKRAETVINYQRKDAPFFIYLPFQSVHIPLQVPKRFEKMYAHVRNKDRRVFSAMVTAMDRAVGRIIKALKRNKQLNNTLIIFTSDGFFKSYIAVHFVEESSEMKVKTKLFPLKLYSGKCFMGDENGGAPRQGGNNWPLRGGKSTLWEGGTRVPTFVWGHMLKRTSYVNNGIIHIVDWLPTILDTIGVNADVINKMGLGSDFFTELDGVSQWAMIGNDQPSKRQEFVYALNEVNGRAALRWKQFKLIEGYPGHYSERYSPPYWNGRNVNNWEYEGLKRPTGIKHSNTTLLYDVESDPEEVNDLADKMPELVQFLKRRLRKYKKKLVPANNPHKLRKAHPDYWGGVWSPGWC